METLVQPTISLLEARFNKKAATSVEIQFASLKDRVDRFRQHLANEKDRLWRVLSSYESYATSEDEFQRIFECLDNIEEIRNYLTKRTGLVTVFLPLNMPIYGLVLYGMFPALVADEVFIRAPQRMTDLMSQLQPLLALETYFPNLHIVSLTREDFIQNHVASADVIIFTGKLENAQHVMRKCKKSSLFLFNGWGCNPIIIGEGANLDTAAEKTVQARLFSSGQDCAGPDTVLVSRKHVNDFVVKLKENLENQKVGFYDDTNVTVGPLSDPEQIRLIGLLFSRSCNQIVHGGMIDFSTSTIHPTVIVTDLSQRMNFEELFAPVIFVSVYDDVDQLSQYFEHPLYRANEMYVTLFGSCDYVESLKKSIIVRDQVIFEIDRGNDEFGGYSIGASFAASNRNITPRPILVPREISDYLQPGSAGYKLSPSAQAKIGKQVRKAMTDFFSSILVFGFVFGSVARQQATGSSDINTMVVLERRDEEMTNRYISWLRHLHEQNQLMFKEHLSAVVVTVSDLNHWVVQLDSEEKGLNSGEATSTSSVFTEALAGIQCGVTGNKKLTVEYGKRVRPHSRAAQKKKSATLTDLQAHVKTHDIAVELEQRALDSESSKTADSEPGSQQQRKVETTAKDNNRLEFTDAPSSKPRRSVRLRHWCRKIRAALGRSEKAH